MSSLEALVNKASRGDYDAFEHLVDRYKDGVYRTCALLLGNAYEGLDAAEESFVRAYRSLPARNEAPLFFISIYRQAIGIATALQGKAAAGNQPEQLEYRDPLTILRSFDTGDGQILLLSEVESLVPEDVAAILERSVDDVRGVLSRTRESDAFTGFSGTLASLIKLSAPPGFSQALRERLTIEANFIRTLAFRKRLAGTTVAVIVFILLVAGAWAAYSRYAAKPVEAPPPASMAVPAPPEKTHEIAPLNKAAASTKVLPAPPAPDLQKAPEPPAAVTPPSPVRESLPTILLVGPKTKDISPEKIGSYVEPRLNTPMQQAGEAWVAEMDSDQFWSMYRWLKVFYSRMRIPERAIPNDFERKKIKFKVVGHLPKPVQAANASGQ